MKQLITADLQLKHFPSNLSTPSGNFGDGRPHFISCWRYGSLKCVKIRMGIYFQIHNFQSCWAWNSITVFPDIFNIISSRRGENTNLEDTKPAKSTSYPQLHLVQLYASSVRYRSGQIKSIKNSNIFTDSHHHKRTRHTCRDSRCGLVLSQVHLKKSYYGWTRSRWYKTKAHSPVGLPLLFHRFFSSYSFLKLFFSRTREQPLFSPRPANRKFICCQKMKNLSQCAVGIVHHFQSEAELDVIITMQVFTRICLPGSGATRWPPIRAV